MSKSHSEDHLGEAREYWWNDDYLALIAQRLDAKSCHQVADIGCGKGSMTFRLAPYFAEEATITGVDFEKSYIKAARQKARHRRAPQNRHFFFQEGDAQNIPLEDGQMDLTFCQTLLIHVPDPVQVIREMKRITRPGGWLVGFEPNNLVSHFMFDTYADIEYDVSDMLEMMEVRLRCEQGKRILGEGFNSLGDVIPDLFKQAGLTDIQVWMSDKTLPLIPPYDSREERVRAAQLVDWLENEEGGLGYKQNLRYFRAGGGKKHVFEKYWQRALAYKTKLLSMLKEQKYLSSGGQVMYIIAGRV
ncbi:MAG: class I SAM-dependent methyltransferase [Cyclobacteriaceae bacterium]